MEKNRWSKVHEKAFFTAGKILVTRMFYLMPPQCEVVGRTAKYWRIISSAEIHIIFSHLYLKNVPLSLHIFLKAHFRFFA